MCIGVLKKEWTCDGGGGEEETGFTRPDRLTDSRSGWSWVFQRASMHTSKCFR